MVEKNTYNYNTQKDYIMPTEKNPFDKIPQVEEDEDKIVDEIIKESIPDESVAMMEDGSAVVDLTGKPAMVSEEEMITGFCII